MLGGILLGGSDGGDVDAEGGRDGGGGWEFVEDAEAVLYATGDIAGDVTVEDVLEWSRIQVYTLKYIAKSVCWTSVPAVILERMIHIYMCVI